MLGYSSYLRLLVTSTDSKKLSMIKRRFIKYLPVYKMSGVCRYLRLEGLEGGVKDNPSRLL